MGVRGRCSRRVLGTLGERSTLEDLRGALEAEQFRIPCGITQEVHDASQGIGMVARSNHEVQFDPEAGLTQRILLPSTPSQRCGVEDARAVCFTGDSGERTDYATFTAYDGSIAMRKLVETSDCMRFQFRPLNGPAARSKGMALVKPEFQWELHADRQLPLTD